MLDIKPSDLAEPMLNVKPSDLAEPMLDHHSDDESPSSPPLLPASSSFYDPKQSSGHQHGTASIMSCTINLASTCLGTGVLALPAAYASAGLLTGNAICIGAGLLTMSSLVLLDAAATRAGSEPTFYAMCEAVLPGSGRVVDIAVVINCFGSACAYLVVFGDSLTSALGGLPRRAWVGGAVAAVAPLCFLRSMDALRVTSLLGVICILAVALMVLAFALAPTPWLDPCVGRPHWQHIAEEEAAGGLASTCGGAVVWASAPSRAFAALPIFINAFTCQQNCFTVLRELETPTHARKLLVIVTSVGLPSALYVLVASAGYLTFGAAVQSNVLNSFPQTAVVAAARVSLAFVVLCSYPLQAYPTRVSITSLIASFTPPPPPAAAAAATTDTPARAGGVFVSDARALLVTALFLASSAAVALSVTDLGTVVGLVGATGATTIAVITPGAAFLRAPGPAAPALRVAAAGMLLLGVVVLVGHFVDSKPPTRAQAFNHSAGFEP